jgi:hypothetical protein
MTPVSNVTYYAAMPFVPDEDGNPVPGEAKQAQSAHQALRMAQAMASAAGACGAVAFSRTGDPVLGEFEDAKVLEMIGLTGELPRA